MAANALTPRDAINIRHFYLWLLAAAAAFVAATLLFDGRFLSGPPAWALAATVIVLLLFTLRAYLRFLRAADELLRKIHVEALALAFGAGFIFMTGWRLFERLGAFKLDVNDPVLVMMLFFALGLWLGTRRYES
ncbi:MAG TPA: hypothetical protein VF618_18840 [Thermoanaerobaculia bacterium]